MKALTLWQPYASAIALGKKRIETRSWRTSYRGEIAIHAAARRGPLDHDLVSLLNGANMPFGAIVAVARLVGIEAAAYMLPSTDEAQWGDFSPGRYGWILEDIRPFGPHPVKGGRGLWDWPTERAP
jgi:hypothetical protein